MKINNLHTETFAFTSDCFRGKVNGMENQIAIYALIDPRTKLPFYVGKTNAPKVRLKGHRSARGVTPVAKFIREMKSEGHRPEMEILELCVDKDWQDREGFWVDFYQFRFGITQVLNVMEGGIQSGRFMKHSVATCERLRQMFKGRPISPEQRKQISKSLTGLKQSSETVAKRLATINERRIAAGLEPHVRWESYEAYRAAGRKAYNVTRQRQRRERGQAVLGSEELRQHLAEKQRAYYASLTDEQKEAIAAQRRGKPSPNRGRKFGPQSEERRRQQSERLKAYIASLTPEQRKARMAAARAAQPAAFRAFIDSKTQAERRAMMTAANAANQRSPWKGC